MNLIRLDTVDSTNEVAKRLLCAGDLVGRAAVLARAQTAGRGTRGHSWLSPRDAGIYLSVVEVDACGEGPLTTAYTQAAGVACVEALQAAAGLVVALKPVNDLMLGRAKLGGILTEALVEEARLRSVIIGIGINWRQVPRLLPPPGPPATSVEAHVSGEAFARLSLERVAEVVIERVFAWNDRILAGRLDEVACAYRARTGADWASGMERGGGAATS